MRQGTGRFLRGQAPHGLLLLNMFLALGYFVTLTFLFPPGNRILFTLLIVGEVYHVSQVLLYAFTVWNTRALPLRGEAPAGGVDIFITVAGEPVEIVEETVRAAQAMRGEKEITILNDGKVAGKEDWEDIERLAARLGVRCITREVPGGAKAGNINNALRQTQRPFVAIFDADHVPHEDFLEKTVGYFADERVAFVQSPQYYKNYRLNAVTRGAWEQQELFFGPICRGRNRDGVVTMCGTNMVIRRTALDEVGGIYEESITEDFLTGLFLHERGWTSIYVPEVLAEGLAPEDFLSYYKQQLRWARGNLEVLFKYPPIFRRGLTLRQRMHYLASCTFYLSGPVVVLNAFLPLFFLWTGIVPLTISTMGLAAIFLPYMMMTVYVLLISSNYAFTFRALSFSMASWSIHVQALFSIIFGGKATFAITSKRQLTGNFTRLVLPHLIYAGLVAAGVLVAIAREGVTASIVTNVAWAGFNIAAFAPFIMAALPDRRHSVTRTA